MSANREDSSDRRCTYGVVNGILIRKIEVHMEIYPEIEEQVTQLIQILLKHQQEILDATLKDSEVTIQQPDSCQDNH